MTSSHHRAHKHCLRPT